MHVQNCFCFPETSVGGLEAVENSDVVMDRHAAKRAFSDDSSGLDSVDSGSVGPPPPRAAKLKRAKPTVVAPLGAKSDVQNRSFVGKAPTPGRNSLPQQSKSVPSVLPPWKR